jgi:hypothetical protein
MPNVMAQLALRSTIWRVRLTRIDIVYVNERVEMAIVGLVLIVLLVWALLGSLPKAYRCQRCGYETPNELEALGHEKEASLHKMVQE